MSLPSRDDLAKLSPRAIVAYAARCARRVEPVYVSAMGHRQDLVTAVDSAIRQAERFAAGDVGEVQDSVADTADAAARTAHATALADAADAAARAAHAAARAAHAAVDAGHATTRAAHAAAFAASFAAFAASFAAFAAADAADAAAFMHASERDFERLRELSKAGDNVVIPLGKDGPLGPLWPV